MYMVEKKKMNEMIGDPICPSNSPSGPHGFLKGLDAPTWRIRENAAHHGTYTIVLYIYPISLFIERMNVCMLHDPSWQVNYNYTWIQNCHTRLLALFPFASIGRSFSLCCSLCCSLNLVSRLVINASTRKFLSDCSKLLSHCFNDGYFIVACAIF
jgi:hypothetical protein